MADSFTHVTFDVRVVQGPHRIYAEIVNTYPEEARLDNNQASRVLEVRGPFEPGTDGDENGSPIPCPGLALGLLALLVASIIMGLYRYRGPGG